MRFNLDKTNYILYSEKLYKKGIKFALFAGVYWVWCLFWFLVALIDIVVFHKYMHGLTTGVINLICLFMAAMWIEDLINDH